MPPGPQPIFQQSTGQFDLVAAINQFNRQQLQEDLAKERMGQQHQSELQGSDLRHQAQMRDSEMQHEAMMTSADVEDRQEEANQGRMHEIGRTVLDHSHKSELADKADRTNRLKMMQGPSAKRNG